MSKKGSEMHQFCVFIYLWLELTGYKDGKKKHTNLFIKYLNIDNFANKRGEP